MQGIKQRILQQRINVHGGTICGDVLLPLSLRMI